MRLVLAWGASLEFGGLWSLLWLVSARRAERRLRQVDPDALPRGTRNFYARTRGTVLMIPFLRVATPLLISVGAILIVVGIIGVVT